MSWWTDRLEQVVTRIREPQTLTGAIAGNLDIPYFFQPELEAHMLIVCNDLLRDVPQDELQAIGSPAIGFLSGSVTFGAYQSVVIPLDTINVLAVMINGRAAVEAGAAGFFQYAGVDSSLDSAYTFAAGKCLFYGTVADTMDLVIVEEQPLAVWQGGTLVLPPGYELEVVDRTVQRLQMIDYLKPQTMYGGIYNELV